MQIAILAAVLAALAAAESGGGPVGGVAWRLIAIAAAVLVAPLAAVIGSWRLRNATEGIPYNAGEGIPYSDDERHVARLQSIVVGLWMSAAIVVLFVVQWPRIVQSNWRLAGWPLIDEVLILAPVIAPLLLVWAALYHLERHAQIAAYRARALEPPPQQLARYLWLHVRHHLGLVVLPALAVVGVFEVLAMSRITAAAPDAAWWFALPLLATMLVLMPLAVRRIWPTSPLPAGPLRDELEAVCRLQRCPVREILVWNTDSCMANAAVVGLSRQLRYVLLTDALLARLNASEIAAVVRHELAHLRHWHLPLRLALLAVPLAWWFAFKSAWPGIDATVESAIAARGWSAEALTALVLPAAMLGYALVVVGWYSRVLEHDADLAACQDDDGRFDAGRAADFCRALVRLVGRSRESRLGQWLHPCLAGRLAFLRAMAESPQRKLSFRRRLILIAAAIGACYLAAAAVALI